MKILTNEEITEAFARSINIHEQVQIQIKELNNAIEERDKKIEILSKQVEELSSFISGMCLAKVDLRINGIVREVLIFVLNPEMKVVVQPQAEVKPPPFTIVDSNGE